MAGTSGSKPVQSVLNCSNNSRRHSEVHPMPNAAAAMPLVSSRMGKPRLFSCSNLRLLSGTVWWAIATSEAPIGLDDVCGFRQSLQVALTIRAPDTTVEGKNDGPDA